MLHAGVRKPGRRASRSASNKARSRTTGLTGEAALPAQAWTGCETSIDAILHQRIPWSANPGSGLARCVLDPVLGAWWWR